MAYKGLISRYVKPFRCYIRSRSKAAASLVRNTEDEEYDCGHYLSK